MLHVLHFKKNDCGFQASLLIMPTMVPKELIYWTYIKDFRWSRLIPFEIEACFKPI